MYPSKLLLWLMLALPFATWAQTDCKAMHEGRFKYMADDEEVIVVIKDSVFTEYHNNGKYTIKAKIDWLNSCEYLITIRKVTLPSFPYGPGDEVTVRIDKVEGREISYTISVKNVSWQGKFTKLE